MESGELMMVTQEGKELEGIVMVKAETESEPLVNWEVSELGDDFITAYSSPSDIKVEVDNDDARNFNSTLLTDDKFVTAKDASTKKQRKHICEICGKGFSDKSHLNRHMKAVCSGDKTKAIRKGSNWREENGKLYFQDAEVRKNEANQFQCPYSPCEYRNVLKRRLSEHLQRRHARNAEALSKDRNHMLSNFMSNLKQEKQHKHNCQACGSAFARQIDFNQHVKKCPSRPGMEISKRNSYWREDKGRFYFRDVEVHKNDKNQFQCPYSPCEYRNLLKIRLTEHILRCHEERPGHVCSECGKKFGKESELLSHVAGKHGGGHLCDLCGLSVTSTASLRKHKRVVHLGIRPHKCTHCEKTFPHKAQIRLHMQTKHGLQWEGSDSQRNEASVSQSASATVGKNVLVSKEPLQRLRKFWKIEDGQWFFGDLKIQTSGNGKYLCPFTCTKTCSTRKALGKHIGSTHPDPSVAYPCEQCEKTYYHRYKLAEHVKSKHGYQCE